MAMLHVKSLFVQLSKQPESVRSPLFKISLSLGYLNSCNYLSPTSFTAVYPAAERNETGSCCHSVLPWKCSIDNSNCPHTSYERFGAIFDFFSPP